MNLGTLRRLVTALTAIFTIANLSHAKGAGTSGGLTLLEAPAARPAALAEAYSAATDDISALAYNPASLSSLSRSQASFLYEKGLADDSFGQFLIGSPLGSGGVGLSLGYYSGGDFELNDGVNPISTVNAQTDLMAVLGYSKPFGPLSLGLSGKYLSSKLIDQYKASAFAADFGAQYRFSSRLNLGFAVQNIGSQLKFIEEGDNLPRTVRAGAAFDLIPEGFKTTLLLDIPYFVNEQELRPALGVESMIGPVALRVGYKSQNDLNSITAGAGFVIDRWSMDYAFGLVKDLDSTHRVSVSLKFGNERGDDSSRSSFSRKTTYRQSRYEEPVRYQETIQPVAQEQVVIKEQTAKPKIAKPVLKKKKLVKKSVKKQVRRLR